MKNFRNLLFIFVFSLVVSFAFAQVDEMVEESTDTVVDTVDDIDSDVEETQDEDNELSGIEGASIVSQQVDEESDIELHEEGGEQTLLDRDSLKRSDIGEILDKLNIGFCNDGIDNITNSLNAIVTEGTPYKVCVIMGNEYDKDVVINLDFVDVGVDQYGNLACDASKGFEKYVINPEKINKFRIPAGNYLIKEFEVLYPIGMKENQAGCFALWIDGEQDIQEGNGGGIQFSAISRKSVLASFFVGSVGDIKNELSVKNIKTSINEMGEVILTFDVTNLGNLENEIKVEGYIKNIFGFKKDFSSMKQSGIEDNIIVGHTSTIEVNMGLIPNYGGLFNIEFTVTGTPYFSYDLSDDFDKSLLEPLTYAEKTTYFEMPWLICIIVVIIIILLIVLFRRPKPQVVYVQAPQQPVGPQYQQPQYQQPQYQQPQVPQQPQQPMNQ